MARNQEKAQTTLARFRAAKEELEKGPKQTRPFLTSEVITIPECERWRSQVISEVGKKVSQIQNPGLGEFRIRDLNDEINKLLREKKRWEDRIVELGGPDLGKTGPRMLEQGGQPIPGIGFVKIDAEGKEVPGVRGYKYFGAAKDLPGVRELFQQEAPQAPRKTRGDLFQYVDADYYGYRDEDDGVLLPLEAEAEKESIARAVREWEERKSQQTTSAFLSSLEGEKDLYAVEPEPMDDDLPSKVAETASAAAAAAAARAEPVNVPSAEEIKALILQRKKEMLLQQYASEDLLEQEQEARQLSGRS